MTLWKPLVISIFLNPLSYTTFRILFNIENLSCGLKYIAAFPATSGNELALLIITGHLQANDSKMGIPKPS